MSFRIVQSVDPSTATIRTYVTGDRSFDYLETVMGPVELAIMVGELAGELARMQQYSAAEARRAAKG
jgi:hypothetical protein